MLTVGIARIGNEVEVRYLSSGQAVLELALAYDYGKSKDGERPTQWVRSTMFGDRCVKLAPYLSKGAKIYVEMKDIHLDSFTRKDGTSGSSLKAIINDIQLVEKPKVDQPKQNNKVVEEFDSDIPF